MLSVATPAPSANAVVIVVTIFKDSSKIRADAVATGGGGGVGRGAGNSGGDGGTASAVASASSESRGVTAWATQEGGAGGAGFEGAEAGDGADSHLDHAVDGTTAGHLNLRQHAFGGAGGSASGGGSAGGGGAASSQLAASTPAKEASSSTRTSSAAPGATMPTVPGGRRRREQRRIRDGKLEGSNVRVRSATKGGAAGSGMGGVRRGERVSQSRAIASGDGKVQVDDDARGGNGRRGGTATSAAIGQNAGTSSVEVTARSFGGAGAVGGTATAKANALSTGGGDVSAKAIAKGGEPCRRCRECSRGELRRRGFGERPGQHEWRDDLRPHRDGDDGRSLGLEAGRFARAGGRELRPSDARWRSGRRRVRRRPAGRFAADHQPQRSSARLGRSRGGRSERPRHARAPRRLRVGRRDRHEPHALERNRPVREHRGLRRSARRAPPLLRSGLHGKRL